MIIQFDHIKYKHKSKIKLVFVLVRMSIKRTPVDVLCTSLIYMMRLSGTEISIIGFDVVLLIVGKIAYLAIAITDTNN